MLDVGEVVWGEGGLADFEELLAEGLTLLMNTVHKDIRQLLHLISPQYHLIRLLLSKRRLLNLQLLLQLKDFLTTVVANLVEVALNVFSDFFLIAPRLHQINRILSKHRRLHLLHRPFKSLLFQFALFFTDLCNRRNAILIKLLLVYYSGNIRILRLILLKLEATLVQF